MSKFDPSITEVEFKNDILSFELSGSESYGLDKSMVNCIRRTILTDIPTLSFRVDENIIKDINVTENTGSIHNEMLLQRISLVPLYINPENYMENYMFELKVKHDTDSPFRFITAQDFTIYPLLPKIQQKIDDLEEEEDAELNQLLKSKSIDNYDLKNPISSKQKENIFRPFKFKRDNSKNYCLITELKNTNTKKTSQSIDLYGVPSLSTGKEHARFQPVSLVTYSFVKDDDLIASIIKERISLENIPKEKQESFTTKIMLSESEKYYSRDLDNEPYKYNFSLKSVHYYDAGEIFMKSIDIIIKNLDNLKLQFLNVLKDKDSAISIEKMNDIVFHILIHNEGHSLGNLIQNHMVRRCINEDSIFQLCGYKKTHPLENTIKLIITLNPSNKIIKESEMNKFQKMITFIMEEIDVIKQEFKSVATVAESSDLIK